ncbi:uncharacterized protein LAJ45_04259 [Morchella importuna]|uniref:uncharacterized protein n=1 Tax=Morchella importuna TaxID=1174673 RepID=UPI001E8E73B7|nr:uncharacterized protein LAJ45_04259 [Morchella importuna]KAH8151637.1 hypothetical protein LAJ45_04259 [Morchella importuna]
MADYRDLWSPAKIFSPTTTRQQSQSTKDWTYADQWLRTRYHPRPVPPFERTPDTLKALLALAAANEAADDERALAKKVKERTLDALQKRDAEAEHLTAEGVRALNSLALLAVAVDAEGTGTVELANQLITLTKHEFALTQQSQHLQHLHTRLESDLATLTASITRLTHGAEYRVPAELAAQVGEWGRATRHLAGKVDDYRERLQDSGGGGAGGKGGEGTTVEALIECEKEVLALKERVLDLEARVKAFQGLPPERDLARVEVERVERELAGLEERREALYDNMVGG